MTVRLKPARSLHNRHARLTARASTGISLYSDIRDHNVMGAIHDGVSLVEDVCDLI